MEGVEQGWQTQAQRIKEWKEAIVEEDRDSNRIEAEEKEMERYNRGAAGWKDRETTQAEHSFYSAVLSSSSQQRQRIEEWREVTVAEERMIKQRREEERRMERQDGDGGAKVGETTEAKESIIPPIPLLSGCIMIIIEGWG